jgi:excisionase family DNA binding protein
VILSGPGVLLTAEDCVTVDRQLLEAIRLGWNARGRTPPHALLALADQINRCAAQFRASVQVEAGHGTVDPRTGRRVPVSDDKPVWLTTAEAAGIAGVSARYVRELARKGDVEATRSGQGGAWVVDAASLQVWMTHRTEHDREAA